MKDEPSLIDDLLKIGSSALGILFETRHDLLGALRDKSADFAERLDLVSRSEFDAALAIIATARQAQEDLKERVAALESKLKPSSATKTKKGKAGHLRTVKHNKRRKAR